MLYPMLANFVVTGAILALVYEPMPVEHLGLTGIISLFGFVAGLLMISAYRNGDAAVVAPMQYSQILWATGFGYFLFGEKLDIATGIGAGLIIVSGIYIVIRESRLGAESQTPVLRTRSRASSAASFRISSWLRLKNPRR